MLELALTVVVLMSTFKNKNSLRTITAQIVQKLKNNEARPKFTGSYQKKRVFNSLRKSKFAFYLDITNVLIIFMQIRYIEVFDLTNPRYNERISSVPW